MDLNERLFIIVPLISLLCNAFLFVAVLGAKKSRLIYAFMAMLVTFTIWCAGSLFMRMTLAPGPDFWYQVSIAGIFLVPVMLYNFIYCFVDSRGQFVRVALFVIWIPLTLLNLFNVFITNPHMVVENGEKRFAYGVSPLIIIPLILAVATLWGAWRLAVRAVREGRVALSSFRPLMVGVGVMFAGALAALLPQMVSLPVDTFVCGINAICLYYALHTKRLVRLQNLVSNGTSYLLAVVFSVLIIQVLYNRLEQFCYQLFPDGGAYWGMMFALLFSVMTVCIFLIIRLLMENLFVKPQESRQDCLRQFGASVNKSLALNEILLLYRDFLQETVPDKTARVFLLDKKRGEYRAAVSTNSSFAMSDVFTPDNPVVILLKQRGAGLFYSDIQRTRIYRSMWESEKQRLQQMRVNFLLPVICDDEMTAITVFCDNGPADRQSQLRTEQISFLESGVAMLSMALKNATLYQDIQNKAERDSMTGLYNRSYFTERLHRDFRACARSEITLLLISFDDFSLYNELYGIAEGDAVLKEFGGQLQALVGSRGTAARYGGKEFAVSFPRGTTMAAENCAAAMRAWLQKRPLAGKSHTHKYLTFSAGISAYPYSAATEEQLLSYANMALFSAKSTGKNKIIVYTPSSPEDTSVKNSQMRRQLADNFAATIYALTAAIDAKDHYTFSHSENVAAYASALAAAIPLDADHIEIVRQAGLLHDIGKISIPESILSKTTKLTAEEYEIMKQHVEASIAMIKYLPSLDYVIPSAIGHHERWDGKGYPRGLVGEQNPVAARCLCIADAFDAMTSKRSYRDAMNVEDALAEIRRNLGTQFDPKLGALFITLVESGKIQPQNAANLTS